MSTKEDNVNNPNHYTVGGIEPLDYLEAKLTESQFEGYLMGNVLKYLSRAEYKGKKVEDIKKAKFYLDRLVQGLSEQIPLPIIPPTSMPNWPGQHNNDINYLIRADE